MVSNHFRVGGLSKLQKIINLMFLALFVVVAVLWQAQIRFYGTKTLYVNQLASLIF